MKNLNIIYALATCLLMYSCGTTDAEAPTFCSADGDVAIVAEVEAMAGETLSLVQTVCDNDALGTANWDLHSAEGHAHEGEEEEDFTLFSGSWDYDFADDLTGTTATSGIMTEIPNDVRGVWDIVISLVDAEGNIATDVVTPLHIENEIIPLFELLDVNGVDPATWTGEQTWEAGPMEIKVRLTAFNDGVITEWHLELEPEDAPEGTAPLAEFEGDATDLDAGGEFTWNFTIPEDASTGEYHLHMEAKDSNQKEMETGFHVEIE